MHSTRGANQQAAEEALFGMHWDLNALNHVRQIAHEQPSERNLQRYREICQSIQLFISQAIQCFIFFASGASRSSRCILFIQMEGWKLFTICAFSDSFRNAFMGFNDMAWSALENLIAENARSIEVFALGRGLPWTEPLLENKSWALIPDLAAILRSESGTATEHPHHTVQNEAGILRRPVKEGRAQVNINSNILHSSCPTPDPSMRKPGWPACDLCGAIRGGCGCQINVNTGDLVELVQYGDKGVGIRALTNIKKGDILGEFTGEILAPNDSNYSNYALAACLGRSHQGPHIFYIDPAFLGNWARYMNHSCEASTYFSPIMAGDRAVMVAIADRDISIHEEITINYGPGYWTGGRICQCGTMNCYSPPPPQPPRRVWCPPE